MTIYLSSTYQDLKDYRAAVDKQLRKMNHQVIAMETYVAQDERPLDKCVADVESADLYVGLFAWRYGYIPKTANNPEKLSITELEYHAARTKGIPTLVFLLADSVAWLPGLFDAHTGTGEGGRRIIELRRRLTTDHVVSFFTSPDDLAASVGAAVYRASAVSGADDKATDLASVVSADAIDRPEMLFGRSYVKNIVDNIAKLGDAPLLKVDLWDGSRWWSTRLYGLAVLAQEYTSADWFLFLEHGTKYVGMMRASALRRALVAKQPELDAAYRRAQAAPLAGPPGHAITPGEVLEAYLAELNKLPGGEQAVKRPVTAADIRGVGALENVHVERAGTFDPLATRDLLHARVPFVPVTSGGDLVKVIDREGVATAIAIGAVERELGR